MPSLYLHSIWRDEWRTSEKASRGRNDCVPLHCTLSSVFVLAVWLWMNAFRSLTAHHLSALVLNTENEIFMWECERTAATSQSVNENLHQQIYNKHLTSRYEIEIDVLQWRILSSWHFSFFKNQILQKLNTYSSMHYCQINHWKHIDKTL